MPDRVPRETRFNKVREAVERELKRREPIKKRK
jgi:hypothetical protein